MATKAKTFRGGIHPDYRKELTAGKQIEACPLPDEVILPLQQHTGAPCKPLVAVGDRVTAGQKIGEADAFISAPVHASVSGEVTAIEERLCPLGTKVNSVVIKVDKEATDLLILPILTNPTAEEIKERAREAGLVGLGGAAFPTHVKLSPPPEKPIDTVIINGCECELYLTCDHRQMLEEGDYLLKGADLLRRATDAGRVVIAIEDNKPDAIVSLSRKAAGWGNIEVLPVRTKYPQGAEKQLIKVIHNKEVPSGGLPADVGALVQNVGTTIALAKAVYEGIPLTSRVVTVSGLSISEPKNLRVALGTPVSALIEAAGGFKGQPGKVVVGGPMTGVAQFCLEAPVVKGTSGVVVFPLDHVETNHAGPCIRCGRCVDACPMGLMPQTIAIYSEIGMFDMAEEFRVKDCMECGCCSYVCPMNRPIVHLVKLAKLKLASGKV